MFPAGRVQWDDDLVVNSQVPLETAVRVSEVPLQHVVDRANRFNRSVKGSEGLCRSCTLESCLSLVTSATSSREVKWQTGCSLAHNSF